MKRTNPTPAPDVSAIDAPCQLIPLATIAPELTGTPTVDDLSHRLAEDVLLDDIGRRCVSVELATLLLDAEHARRAANAERAAERRAAAASVGSRRSRSQDAEIAQHVRSIRVDELVAGGLTPAVAALDGPPVYEGAIPAP